MIIFYHNPRCRKSREALTIIESKGVEVDLRLYLKEGIEADDVVSLSKKLGMHPSEFIRKNEPEYKQLGTDEFSVEEWADIIENNPILLERPILVVGKKAVIGRPPEKVLEILE